MASNNEIDNIALTANPFYAFITDQHNGMVDEEFKKVKLQSKDKLVRIVYDKIKTPLDLFEKLCDNGIISEDDTTFLEEVYHHIQNKIGLHEIEEYKRKRKEHKERIRLLSVKTDSLFVGRDKVLHKILQAFAAKTGKCCCVILAGSPGIGKTKLSIQTCAIYPAFLIEEKVVVTTYLINLRNLMSMNEVGAAIMNAIGVKDVVPSTFDVDELLGKIRDMKSETIVYLDNADDVLRPRRPVREHFINFLVKFIREENQRVKFLITTRYRVDNESLLSVISFHQLDIKPLQVLDAMSLLRRSSDLPNLDETICKDLVFVCGHNPHAIRAVASRMKLGHMQPKEFLELLKTPALAKQVFDHKYGVKMSTEGQEIEQQESVVRCLRVVFDQLDNKYKSLLIKLSVFPSFFYRDVASIILGEEKSVTGLYLQDLCIYGLLEFDKLDQFKNIDSCEGDCNQYNVHTLVRLTCELETRDDSLRPFFYTAMIAFLNHYHRVINDICELANKHFKEGLEKRTDGMLSLMAWSRQIEAKSRKAKAEGDLISYSFLCAWVGDQYICQAQILEAHKAADNGLTTLDKLKSGDKSHENTMIAKAACLYVRGRAYIGQQKYEESLIVLHESLALRRKLEGDHTMTARVLNTIGQVFYCQKKLRDAQRYHQEAWDMIDKITGGKPEVHIDFSVYVMNVGTCFRSWGNRYTDAKETEKAKEQYEKALDFFNNALKMQQRSFPGLEIKLTSKILRNRALCYFEMEEYTKALPDAERSLRISQRILKENPDTARCLYFVGCTHHHIGKKILTAEDVSEDEKADAYNHYSLSMKFLEEAYNMEHSLGPHRRSIDYDDLKKEIMDVLSSLRKDEDAKNLWEQRFAKTDQQDTTGSYYTCYEHIGAPTQPTETTKEEDDDEPMQPTQPTETTKEEEDNEPMQPHKSTDEDGASVKRSEGRKKGGDALADRKNCARATSPKKRKLEK
ncbi:uncharacterized protein [Antedon mediterranea]|uniref:uncharacterized protein n=1 Tax=Antedon mediterranea TaxID=105859 RepID=UPI003AF52F9F